MWCQILMNLNIILLKLVCCLKKMAKKGEKKKPMEKTFLLTERERKSKCL